MGRLRFTAVLQPRGPAAAVVLEDAQVQAVGEGAKRFPVRATVNGYEWRTTVTRMRGEFLLGRKEQGEVRGDIETPRTIAVETTLDMPAPADVESRL